MSNTSPPSFNKPPKRSLDCPEGCTLDAEILVEGRYARVAVKGHAEAALRLARV